MASAAELRASIDLHELAERLGLERPGGRRGNYRSPAHHDKNPSLSVYDQGRRWKDHSNDAGGSCIDLVMHVRGCDAETAIRTLHEMFAIPPDPPPQAPRRERSRAEFIAERCLADPLPVVEYLAGRAIPDVVSRHAIERRALGWNTWRSDSVPAGQSGHGGPAAAFVVRSANPGHVVAVDLRYVDPAMNGGVKTMCQGERAGFWWTSCARKLAAARQVFVVESPINALSVEAAALPGCAALATRGTGNVRSLDWRALAGKQVWICMDHDKPDAQGVRPGLAAAWALHEALTAVEVSALLVDQTDWEVNDVNDLLQAEGAEKLAQRLRKVEPWLIAGMPGRTEEQAGKRRVFLPFHDDTTYWRYRIRPDFTSYVAEVKKDEEGGERLEFRDLAGFRVAAISRVSIASAVATMTGEADVAPRVVFAVSVQLPRHGAQLVRRVFEDERLHNVEHWKRLGPVFDQARFLRMVNILERAADIGSRDAANFVGLCWRDGRLRVNEGADCYFTHPEQQCPYHGLRFPSGTPPQARHVLEAYAGTFQRSAALLVLVWGLGGHLKTLLGFWPHMQMQAGKGAGKSTLVKALERTLAMTMFSGQSLQTEYRLVTSLSHTSHPIGWEELSTRKQETIDKAVGLLQEAYQYTVTRRSSEQTEYIIAAPVLLAGEDVPVRSLIGKIVRTDLNGKKGPLLPEDLPRFPLRQWIEFLATRQRAEVRALYSRQREALHEQCRASGEDDGAVRMLGNYAAVATAWTLLCEWLEMDSAHGAFQRDLLAEMNAHIAETSADREPWVWIVETLLSEIAAGEYRFPYRWDVIDDEAVLCVRTSHVMDHLARTPGLRDKYNSLPVKSDRVFRQQLFAAGVVAQGSIERTISERRVSYLTALSLPALAQFGLHGTPPATLQDRT